MGPLRRPSREHQRAERLSRVRGYWVELLDRSGELWTRTLHTAAPPAKAELVDIGNSWACEAACSGKSRTRIAGAMDPEPVIGFGGMEHRRAAAALWCTSVPAHASRQETSTRRILSRLEGEWAVFVVAQAQGRLIGAGLGEPWGGPEAQPSAAHAHISLVVVDRPWRRRGVATRIMAFLEAELARQGYASAALHVLAANTTARRFYEAIGWTRQGPGPPHEDGPQVVYTKALIRA